MFLINVLHFLDTDECLTEGICQHGATCINNVGSYSCTCAPGYADPNCQTGQSLILLMGKPGGRQIHF